LASDSESDEDDDVSSNEAPTVYDEVEGSLVVSPVSENDDVQGTLSLTDHSESVESSDEELDEETLALKYAIVNCIFHAIEMTKETGTSLNNFEALLSFARHMYCLGKEINEDDPDLKSAWPKTWEDAKKYLIDLGYKDAKEYFICLNASHPRHWDIMDHESEVCRHCEEKGKIKYYILDYMEK